jgi:hypothetical protein
VNEAGKVWDLSFFLNSLQYGKEKEN